MKRNMGLWKDISIWTGQTLVASILVSAALALVALGCGEQKQKATAETNSSETPIAAQEAAPAPGGQTVAASATGTPESVGQVESLPPDVAATAPDTLVTPGSVVVITAIGSADVTSVTLADGVGEKTPFTFDSESNLWRASYRVPVKIREDRIGLSVTATTDASRYKRVWLFLKTRESAEKAATTVEESGD
jgi:hypothetical protein